MKFYAARATASAVVRLVLGGTRKSIVGLVPASTWAGPGPRGGVILYAALTHLWDQSVLRPDFFTTFPCGGASLRSGFLIDSYGVVFFCTAYANKVLLSFNSCSYRRDEFVNRCQKYR